MRPRDLIPAALVVCIALMAGPTNDECPALPSDGPQFQRYLEEHPQILGSQP